MPASTIFLQTLVNGLVLGTLYILIASGFTVVFGIMRVVNFAHGEFYMLGGLLIVLLFGTLGLNFAVALVLTVVIVGLAGALIEQVVFRPFRGNELSGMIAALGLSIILQNGAALIFGTSPLFVPDFVSGSVAIGPAMVPAGRLVAIGAALATLAGFTAFLRFTKMGRAMRAVVQDTEIATIQGIRPGIVYPVGFALGVALAGMAGGIMGPLFTVDPYMGTTPLLKAFVIVVLGGLGSMSGAAIAGLFLGLFESFASSYFGAALADVLQLVLVMAVLLIRPQGLMGERDSDGSSNARFASSTPVSDAIPSNRWLILAAAVALVPIVARSPFLSHLGVMAALSAIAVVGLTIISRVGQLSLCHAGFIGVGAYTSAIVTKAFDTSAFVGIVCACVVVALLSATLGYFVLKTRGVYFVLITFTFGQVVGLLFLDLDWLTGGAAGIPGIAAPSLFGASIDAALGFYPLALAALILVVIFAYRLLGSSIGRAFDSIASNLPLAESSGIPTFAYQNLAFVIGSVLAALSGALMAHYVRFVSPTSYEYDLTVTLIVMMVLGGRGSVAGAVIGTVFVTLLSDALRDTQQLQNVLYGVAILVMLRFAPDGIVSIPPRLTSRLRLALRQA
jgi:branched-subunit amino acid ABC-type transport system permease component